jgi:hypothetical protein
LAVEPIKPEVIIDVKALSCLNVVENNSLIESANI